MPQCADWCWGGLPPWGLCCIWADFAHPHFTVPSLSSHYRTCVLTPAQSCSTHTVLLDLNGVPWMSFVCLIIQVTDNQIGSAQIQLESAWICSLGSPPGRCSVSLPGPQLALESIFSCAPAEPASLCNSRCTHSYWKQEKKSQYDLSGIFWNQYMSPVDFSFLFLPCSYISSHHCCKEQQYCVKDAGIGFKRHILFLAVSQKYMWPQAIELSISVLWLLIFKKGDSSASLGYSEKCVHVISLSKGAVMWTICEPNTKFFHAFSHSCIKTPLVFLINLRLFHCHLWYPDGSNIFSLPNPYQVPIQQFQNSTSLSQSIRHFWHFCPPSSVLLCSLPF